MELSLSMLYESILSLSMKHLKRRCGGSESVMKVWLYGVNGIVNLDTIPTAVRFVTLRTFAAEKYCHESVISFTEWKKNSWTTTTTLLLGETKAPFTAEDLATDGLIRCGTISLQNLTRLCQNPLCVCTGFEH